MHVVERLGHADELSLVRDDAVGEPATAHKPEDAIPDDERGDRIAYRDHGPRDLDAGNVRRRAGRWRVPALTLEDVGGVHARVRGRDQQLELAGLGVRTLADSDDLSAAGAGVDHTSH